MLLAKNIYYSDSDSDAELARWFVFLSWSKKKPVFTPFGFPLLIGFSQSKTIADKITYLSMTACVQRFFCMFMFRVCHRHSSQVCGNWNWPSEGCERGNEHHNMRPNIRTCGRRLQYMAEPCNMLSNIKTKFKFNN